MTHQELYEMANDVFDNVVFDSNPGLIDKYNELETDTARSELFDIINEMTEHAFDYGINAMEEVAEKNKERFIRLVENLSEEEI